MEPTIKTDFTESEIEDAKKILEARRQRVNELQCFAKPASETADIDRKIADEDNYRRSLARQRLEQWDYEAKKQGLIFVPLQGKNMTPAEYDEYLANSEE